MFLLRMTSCPHSEAKEGIKRWKEIRSSSNIPDYMNLVGSWTVFVEDKGQTVQVFEVEESKVGKALQYMDIFVAQNYGDIPGLSFTHKVAYTPDEIFEASGL